MINFSLISQNQKVISHNDRAVTSIEMYQSFILIPINLFSLPRNKTGCLLTLIFEIHQAQDQSFIRSRELYIGLCNNTSRNVE